MVSCKNEDVFIREPGVQNIRLIVLDSIRRALIPFFSHQRLLRRQNLHEPAAIGIKPVCLRDVPIQRNRVELREDIDTFQSGMKAVANRDVNQPEFPGDGDARFGAVASERK